MKECASGLADSHGVAIEPDSPRDPEPGQWPVLVTGAGGFVGGHVARLLATAGHCVRGLTRQPPHVKDGDPPIEWIFGDLLDRDIMKRAVAGVRGVIHVASWVSLGPDRRGLSQRINVESTAQLLADAAAAGVQRLVYTSTIYSLAAGTVNQPADESTAWNLHAIESAYTRTKRRAEQIVLEANRPGFSTIALCPGMVQGSPRHETDVHRDHQELCPRPCRHCPAWRHPIIDVELLALAHRRALVCGEGGARYAVVGPYLSYGDLAALVASLTGRPRWRIPLPDRLEPMVVSAAGWSGPLARRWWPDVSRQLAAGGFLRLFVRGDRANACFGLVHPPAVESIARSL